MIIDTHTHVGLTKDKGDGNGLTLEELKDSMKRYGIDKAIAFPFNEPGDLVEASIRILKAADESIIPFLRFDPKAVTADQLDRILTENAFKGIKLHTRGQDFSPLDSRYFPLYKVIERHGLPIIFHTRKEANPNSDPDMIARIAERLPGIDIVLAHFAFFSEVAFRYIEKEPNLYTETSGVSTNHVIKRMADKVGSNKIMFGSDIPYSDQEIELMKVRKSGLGKKDMDRILYQNAMRILRMK
ncbi:MAG: amidohydrolase [Candidatus Micrarchaeota archaeon]|nr:amidohydrolase [Candidatus Micrarchaeota archaeon]